MPIVNRAPFSAPVSAATFDASNPPAHLKPLLAMNPKLARDLVQDPGLRAFLERNRDRLVSASTGTSPSHVRDDVTLDTWCHSTSIVPPAVRDEEYIMVVARGSAYAGAAGDIEIPLDDGKLATTDGRIVWMGKTKDLLATFVPDTDGHYPGSGAVSIELPVHGAKGERVALTYCRFKPDAQGRASPRHAAWPDTFRGVYGGYAGRDQKVVIAGGARAPPGVPGLSSRRLLRSKTRCRGRRRRARRLCRRRGARRDRARCRRATGPPPSTQT